MVFGLLINMEWKMDLKWNTNCDEIETVVETGIKWRMEYGLEQDMEWKTEWNIMGKWNGAQNRKTYPMAQLIKEKYVI